MGICCTKKPRTFREKSPTESITFAHQRTENKTHKSVILKNVADDYDLGKILGTGHFGTVRSGVYKNNRNFQAAIKTIDKNKIKGEMHLMKREIEILMSLDHPNIIKLYDVYEDAKYIHLVLEECTGGELFSRIVKKGKYSEQEAALLMEKILSAVGHLHHVNICHRDLKPENFMFLTKDPDSELKLIDFGLSNKFARKQGELRKMNTMVGTPYYVAPEVLRGSYDSKCDMWSVGIIMYVILSGTLPFPGTTPQEIFNNIIRGRFALSGDNWDKISILAKDLIRSLIVKDAHQRLNAEQALAHDWFRESELSRTISINPDIILALKNYRSTSGLQKEAMGVIAKYLSSKQVQELKDAFLYYDTSRSGYLTLEEVRDALASQGFNLAKEEIQDIINEADYAGDGRINYTEFLAATLSSIVQLDEQ